MNVISLTLTERGRGLAQNLPWPVVHGSLASTIAEQWDSADGFVVFAATGIAVRVIAPLLGRKDTDPAIVCVDEGGRWAVALTGGHGAGGNQLARDVAALIGAEPVVTTATDAVGVTALDQLDGFNTSGDVAAVTRALLDGAPVWLDNRCDWPLPSDVVARTLAPIGSGPGIIVTDSSLPPLGPPPGVAVLHPPSLVVGIGASSAAPTEDLRDLAAGALGGCSPLSVSAIATIDRKRAEPAIVALAAEWDVPIRDVSADVLAAVPVPNPSETVRGAVGTASVAEAAALAVGGPGSVLLVEKVRSATATVAVARRRPLGGHLAIVGIGPGSAAHRTPAATAAIRHADVVIGYGPYVEMISDAIAPAALTMPSPIGSEELHAKQALSEVAGGRRVALVCSGDVGVFALASLVLERCAGYPSVDPIADIDVVPGVTAALASAAALGAPLGHDHAAISLSDLLTPWPVIERRLRAAADADLVVSLYNPRSQGRQWQLPEALAILGDARPPSTPVGIVSNAGRDTARTTLTTLADCGQHLAAVDMSTLVIVGASSTRIVGDRMVTPHGYQP